MSESNEVEVEPPSKKDSKLWHRRSSLEDNHFKVLEKYGMNSDFTTDTEFQEVTNELVVSLLFLQPSIHAVYNIFKKMFGLANEETTNADIQKFRSIVKELKTEADNEQRKADKYLLFKNDIAFDLSEFFTSKISGKVGSGEKEQANCCFPMI
uniref:Uncharacterized protein n=1 Tax=Caenorhabditis japonica TaxID=281687 RepID=A0A8R1ESA9_CAEJA